MEQNLVQVVFDQDVLLEEWYVCSDGTTTGYMKVKTKPIINNFLTSTSKFRQLSKCTIQKKNGDYDFVKNS